MRVLARRRTWVWFMVGAGAATLAGLLILVLDQPTQATWTAAPPGGRPAYYVVQQAENGQRDYLYRIAARTLGDGNRFREIFELNRNRPQPDGGSLTDPARLTPGWVLALPAGADGPEVTVGPLPEVAQSDGTGRIGVGALAVGLSGLSVGALAGWRHARSGREGRVPTVDGSGSDVAEPLPERLRLAEPGRDDELAVDAAEPAPDTTVIDDTELPRPEIEADTAVQVGSADGDRWSVCLAKPSPGGARPAYAWLRPEAVLEGASMQVDLGLDGPWRLVVDLLRAPDVLTITGSAVACRRQAVAIAEQLYARAVDVVVVGDVLDSTVGEGVRKVAAFPTEEELTGSGQRLVICEGLRGEQRRTVRRLAAQPDRTAAFLIVGRAVRGRWAMTSLEGSRP
ncbi:LysM peptidoglycan-binding domain-containing protein [Catellatospora citrea]|uniref:LysM domain-containing protein n=1 Tax=Catellatospora citrea TaxID=53366 RepID=A0A8J3KLB1_9ACTN|nr:hypothetical protein [Catellatospora citrea]RKE10652.1 hypothetical protein C8E86_5568 [Catellatospora citrea]GIG03095.1 hypothetical protein Cci01nite_81880 [Catellatospora citrea]